MKNGLRFFNSLMVLFVTSLALFACAPSTPTQAPPAAGGVTVKSGPPPLTLTSTAAVIPSLTPVPLPTSTITVTPSCTAVPPPTSLPVAKLYDIDIKQLREIPQDLKEQIFYYSGGAGGPGGTQVQSKPPSWVSSYSGTIKPAVPGKIYWQVGYFAKAPLPVALLTLPDNSTVQMEVSITNNGISGFFDASYDVAPQALFGTYKVQITQGKVVLQDSVVLALPTKPIWVSFQGNTWYAGFKPGEQITLSICEAIKFSYESARKYPELANAAKYLAQDMFSASSWFGSVCAKKYLTSISADEYGTFQIHMPSGYTFRVQAQASGVDETVPVCSSAPPLRLKTNDTAQVSVEKLDGLTTADKNRISLAKGTKLKILFGPLCYSYRDTGNWSWIVETDNGTILEIKESDNKGGYYLEPVSP